MTLYHILPFSTNGKQIPALHDLKINVQKTPSGPFKPGKMSITLKKYVRWLQWLETINNKAAWKYLNQQTSGVIQNNGKFFQPAVFASAPFANNVVNVLNKFEVGPDEWGEVEALDVNNLPPTNIDINTLMSWGVLMKYVAEGKSKPDNSWLTDSGGRVALYPAPKANGNVFSPILSDGRPLYVPMSCLEAI